MRKSSIVVVMLLQFLTLVWSQTTDKPEKAPVVISPSVNKSDPISEDVSDVGIKEEIEPSTKNDQPEPPADVKPFPKLEQPDKTTEQPVELGKETPLDTSSEMILETGPSQEELYILGELSTHTTLLGGPRLTLLSGAMGFDSPFGGRTGTKLDMNDDLFLAEEETGVFFGIDVQHSYFHINLCYGFSRSQGEGNIKNEVIIGDVLFQRGSQIHSDMETHWFNANMGYTLLAKNWGGIGIQIGLDYVYVRFISDVRGYAADDPTNRLISIDLDKNVFVPAPTIGGYVDIAPIENFVMRIDLNFMHYDIASRRLTTVTFGIEPRYFLTATQEYYAYFKFKYEYFSYDFFTTQVDGFWEWHSFLFLVGAGIKF